MTPRELAVMAATNSLPDIADADHLPAIMEAATNIERAERVSEALAHDQGWKAGEPTHPMLKGLHAALRAIGAKLRPEMSGPQASAWVDSIALSLSKYSAKSARLAAERAQGEPFPYGLGSVDARLHELAQQIEDRNRAALTRLRTLKRKIEKQAKALPSPEAKPERPMTVEELAATPDHILSLGKKLGFISDEEMAAVEKLREMT
ncbi:hypothetical protein [Sphingobium yanoikuyae]|uniref:hypothetical protein n=1 Tax=Sphingobium yanoikuyae TaxID=13690 RepID=UPI0035C6F048